MSNLCQVYVMCVKLCEVRQVRLMCHVFVKCVYKCVKCQVCVCLAFVCVKSVTSVSSVCQVSVKMCHV